jgi:hypothetical protein
LRVAARAAGLDRVVHRLPADRRELRSEVDVGLLFAFGGVVIAFGVQRAVGQRVDAGEDRHLVARAVLHAGGFQVLENALLESLHALVVEAGFRDVLGRQRLVALQRLDGERAGDAQLAAIDRRLIVERDFLGRFVVGQRTERDALHALVEEAVPQIPVLARQALLFVLQGVPGVAGGHQPRLGDVQRDTRRVGGDPAAAPLLGDVRGGAGTAGRVENEVAGVGGHQACSVR